MGNGEDMAEKSTRALMASLEKTQLAPALIFKGSVLYVSFNAQRPWRRTHSQIFKPRKAHIKLLYVVTIPPGSVVVQSVIRV